MNKKIHIFFKKYLHYIIISTITLLALGKTVFLYFSFEDFDLFYRLQDSESTKNLLTDISYSRHLNYYYNSILPFKLFGYNPVPYHFIILTLAVLAHVLFYKVIRGITKNKIAALFVVSIFASAYYGLDSYTWNLIEGYEFTTSLILVFGILLLLLKFFDRKKIFYYLAALLIYGITLFFYKGRVFDLPPLVLLLILFFSPFTIPRKIVLAFPFLIKFIIIFFSNINAGSKIHMDLQLSLLFNSFFGTLGNLFLPSYLTTPLYSYLSKQYFRGIHIDTMFAFVGVIVLVVLIFLIFVLIKKNKLYALFAIYSLFNFLFSVAVIPIASITESNSYPTVADSTQHGLSSAVLWSSALIGIILGSFLKKRKSNKIIMGVAVLIIGVNVILSITHITISEKGANRELRYFYTEILRKVPKVTDKSVFYFYYMYPKPRYPFSAGDINIKYTGYLAGFYGIHHSEIIIPRTFSEAVDAFRKNNIPVERFHYFYYRKNNLMDLTKKLNSYLRNGGKVEVTLKDNQAQKLNIESIAPYYLEFAMFSEPDFSRIEVNNKYEELVPYYDLYIKKRKEGKQFRFSVSPDRITEESVTPSLLADDNYNTNWNFASWEGDGVQVVLDFGKKTRVGKLVWSSSRTEPRAIRSPIDYEIFTSDDNKVWKSYIRKKINKPLSLNEYFMDDIDKTTRFVMIRIYKTYLNSPPAIDEIEVFDNEIQDFDYKKYYMISSSPLKFIPNREVLEKLYEDVYANNLHFNINYKVDGDIDFHLPRVQRTKRVKLNCVGLCDYKMYFPADGFHITGLKFEEENFPLNIGIDNVTVKYLEYEDFRKL